MGREYFDISVVVDTDTAWFQALSSLITDEDIRWYYFFSLENFLLSSYRYRSQLVIISTGIMNMSVMDYYRDIRSQINCPVVVAGVYSDLIEELKIRLAGVSCYLLFPEEMELLKDLVAVTKKRVGIECQS